MLDSIRRYQQHRIFEIIFHNINFHLYLTTVVTLVVLLFSTLKIAVMIFFVCLLVSLIYNIDIYRRRQGDYYEAAIFLDRKLNARDMFITLLEYPNSSDNLMLKLLHDRAENISRKILDQDFDRQDKQILNKTLLRFLIVCTGFFLLFLLLSLFDSDLKNNNNSINQKNNLSVLTDRENKAPFTKQAKNGNSEISKSNAGGVNPALQKQKAGEKSNRKGPKALKSGNKVSQSQSNRGSNADKSFKENRPKTSTKDANRQSSSQDDLNKNKAEEQSSKPKVDVHRDSKSKSNIANLEKKSFQKTNSLKNDPLKTPKQDHKQNINKSKAKAKLDSRKSGDLGGRKLVEKVDFKDQRDIRNTLYKAQQDELEQVLNNPRMPKSYKAILKRFYSSEKR